MGLRYKWRMGELRGNDGQREKNEITIRKRNQGKRKDVKRRRMKRGRHRERPTAGNVVKTKM